MNEIDRFLDQACRSVSGTPSLRRHLREELREHLEAMVQSYVASGMAREEAVRKALEEFGLPQEVREGLEEVYGRRVTALLIEKAMEWREKTMKAEWKWSFAAHTMLVLAGAVLVFYLGSVLVFIMPRVVEMYHSATGTIPYYLQRIIRLMYSWHHFWFLWLTPLALGYALFEWKCKSESKAQIRLAIENVALLIVGAAVCAISFAVMVALVTVPVSG